MCVLAEGHALLELVRAPRRRRCWPRPSGTLMRRYRSTRNRAQARLRCGAVQPGADDGAAAMQAGLACYEAVRGAVVDTAAAADHSLRVAQANAASAPRPSAADRARELLAQAQCLYRYGVELPLAAAEQPMRTAARWLQEAQRLAVDDRAMGAFGALVALAQQLAADGGDAAALQAACDRLADAAAALGPDHVNAGLMARKLGEACLRLVELEPDEEAVERHLARARAHFIAAAAADRDDADLRDIVRALTQ